MTNIGFIFNQSMLIGGGEISGLDLLASLRGSDMTPVAFVPGEGDVGERLRRLGIQIVMTSFPRLSAWSIVSWPRRVRSLAAAFVSHDIAIVHVNGARSMLYAGPAARRAGIPCVWHNRVLHRDRCLDWIRGHYADAVVANSQAVASSLRAAGVRNVSVIYNGFAVDVLQRAIPVDLHQQYRISSHLPVILAVGRLCPWKGFDDLLVACSLLSAQNVPYYCLILGKAVPEDDAYAAALLKKKESLGLVNVQFAGWHDDVAAHMKAATVLAVPSHGEPFGRIVVEAWACGLPVVATDAGGPAEIIRHGENGYLVPEKNPKALAAALAVLLDDAAQRQALAAAGVASAGRFTIDHHRDAVIALYRSLLKHNGRHGIAAL